MYQLAGCVAANAPLPIQVSGQLSSSPIGSAALSFYFAQDRGCYAAEGDRRPVLGELNWMLPLLSGLVENAIYYTPAGGEIVVRTGKGEAGGRER